MAHGIGAMLDMPIDVSSLLSLLFVVGKCGSIPRQYSTDVLQVCGLLMLHIRRWVRKHPAGLPPAPRDQHAASVFPAKTETGNWRENSSDHLSEFLFVFGGRTG